MVAHELCLKCKYWGGDGLCLILFDEELFPNLKDEERVPLMDDPWDNEVCPYADLIDVYEEDEYYEDDDYEDDMLP